MLTKVTFDCLLFSYAGVVRMVVAQDGVLGLLGRGLKTRLITNGIQVIHLDATLMAHSWLPEAKSKVLTGE